MRRVFGLVLVKETNAGVPNLVVTAYDGGVASESIREKVPTAEVVRRLGRRISSVLTDKNGAFALPTQDLEFPGNEPRPDLALVVFAPEDVGDPLHPFPAPPEERVLYMSIIARVDAGAEEAYVIRLLQSEVDKIQVDVPAERLANALEGGWRFRDILTKRMATRNAQERRKSEDTRKLVLEKTKRLSGVPLSLRNHELLVVGKTALEENRETLQSKVVDEGLTRMARSRQQPTMRLYLGPGDLKDLDLKVQNGELSGTVDSENLAAKVRSLMGGVDLIRIRGMNNPTPEELEAKYLGPQPPVK